MLVVSLTMVETPSSAKASLDALRNTDHFCLPLNYYQVPVHINPTTGKEFLADELILELKQGAKGRYVLAFAKTLEAIQKPQLSSENDWVISDKVVSLENEDLFNDLVKVRPESKYAIILNYHTPGINTHTQWSIDGEPGILDLRENDDLDDDFGGPSYWAEDNAEHRPYIDHVYWEKPIKKYAHVDLAKGYKYDLDSTEVEGSEGHIHKIWYGKIDETDRTKLVTNDEIIRDGETGVEIIPRSSYIYLGTYNTGEPKLRRWSPRRSFGQL